LPQALAGPIRSSPRRPLVGKIRPYKREEERMNLLAFRSLLMMLCLFVLVLLVLALLWVTWRRYRQGQSEGGNFHHSLLAEMTWASVPGLILLLLLWPVSRALWGH
jgi:heme/copper-type cytochrome/quinol oxidase subunit 2